MADIQETVSGFKQKAQDFLAMVDRVRNSAPSGNSDLQQRRDSLLSKASVIEGTIRSVTGAIDSAYKTVGSFFGLNGLGGLEMVPLLAIAAGVTAITYWVTDAVKYMADYDQFNKLRDANLSPTAAANVLQKMREQPGIFGFGSKLMDVGLLAGVGILGIMLIRGRRG